MPCRVIVAWVIVFGGIAAWFSIAPPDNIGSDTRVNKAFSRADSQPYKKTPVDVGPDRDDTEKKARAGGLRGPTHGAWRAALAEGLGTSEGAGQNDASFRVSTNCECRSPGSRHFYFSYTHVLLTCLPMHKWEIRGARFPASVSRPM